jgi:hypothetical protein
MSQLDLAQLSAANARLSALRLQGNAAPENGAFIDPAKPTGWLQAVADGLKNPVKAGRPEDTHCERGDSRTISADGTITFYPDIGLAMLREELAGIGRIWLLLRHADLDGKGWLSVAQARALLTKKGAPLRVCGWRQLRNLLRAGQGIFWERDKVRIWLRSVPKVAVALGVARIENRPIALPITSLLNGIGSVRAHFYASFHSGRQDLTRSKPIARATLTQLSGVGRDSQRSYERQTRTVAKPNFAIGQTATVDARQAACWQHGNRVFTLTDLKGRQGAQGKKYLAWQLPNSYRGTHHQQARGLKRRINRQLADLLTHGATGNDEPLRMQRYFESGAAVVRDRGQSAEIYLQPSFTEDTVALWHCF